MIPDRDTDRVYFSKLVSEDKRFTYDYSKVVDVLDSSAVSYHFLDKTSDIWCRDYMPLQLDNKTFVQFNYDPGYLRGYEHLITDPGPVCDSIGIKTIKSNIRLDGGNTVKWSDRVIITDRVYDENPEYDDKVKLLDKISKLLEAEVIIIPSLRSDLTGHADGMIRFVDRDTVIINRLEGESDRFQKDMCRILIDHAIDYIEMPWFENLESKHPLSAIGCYVNYLEIGDLVVFPVFETPQNHDKEALDIVAEVFKDRVVEAVNIKNIAREGGLMNCISWNIKSN